MYFIIIVSHRGLMTIYFKSRASECNMCRENWKTKKAPKLSFFFNGVPKHVTCWIIRINLFIMYLCYHNGITQMLHDNLFQKSAI